MSEPRAPGPVRASGTGVCVDVRVTPRSSRSQVGDVREGRLAVRVTAPPVDHAANEAVVELLARVLGIPKRSIRVVSGQTSRSKTVEIATISVADVERALRSAVERRT
jgi:uncharacterized protein (TIGR00251 family)